MFLSSFSWAVFQLSWVEADLFSAEWSSSIWIIYVLVQLCFWLVVWSEVFSWFVWRLCFSWIVCLGQLYLECCGAQNWAHFQWLRSFFPMIFEIRSSNGLHIMFHSLLWLIWNVLNASSFLLAAAQPLYGCMKMLWNILSIIDMNEDREEGGWMHPRGSLCQPALINSDRPCISGWALIGWRILLTAAYISLVADWLSQMSNFIEILTESRCLSSSRVLIQLIRELR